MDSPFTALSEVLTRTGEGGGGLPVSLLLTLRSKNHDRPHHRGFLFVLHSDHKVVGKLLWIWARQTSAHIGVASAVLFLLIYHNILSLSSIAFIWNKAFIVRNFIEW